MNLFIVLLSVIGTATCVASPFQNLNFDSANTNNLVGDPPLGQAGTTADLLPGWQLSAEGLGILPTTGFNYSPLGLGYATLVSPSFVDSYPVVGAYSLAMLPRYTVTGTFVPFSLSQTGDVPVDTRSIRFLSYGSPVRLTANGSLIDLTYTPVASQPGWNPSVPVYEAVGDLSAFAGLNVDLTFTGILPPNYQGFAVLNGLDEITLSTIPVPEPSTVAVFALGGIALISLRRIRTAKGRSAGQMGG